MAVALTSTEIRLVIGAEIKRIFTKVTDDIQNGYENGTVNDINGNKVCKWTLEN